MNSLKRFLACALACLLFAGSARAGTVVVDKNDGFLSPSDVAVLASHASRWPFDLHVLIGSIGRRPDLGRAAHACITTPTTVCIAVDPDSHGAETRFGTYSGVRPQDYELVASAGLPRFKARDWRGGIEAIADRAASSAGTTLTTPPAPAPVIIQTAPVYLPALAPPAESHWFLWFVFAVLVGLGVFFVARYRKKQREAAEEARLLREERVAAQAAREEERGWQDEFRTARKSSPPPARRNAYAPPAPGPSGYGPPGPVVINNNTARGGSATDLLIGYELGRDSAPRERVVEREVVRERSSPSFTSGGSDNNDAGGAGSSWTDDAPAPASSPSFDSGGGGFDGGGGGGDFGSSSDGGSSDGGGGGGDF